MVADGIAARCGHVIVTDYERESTLNSRNGTSFTPTTSSNSPRNIGFLEESELAA
jgi:hypothetical protein